MRKKKKKNCSEDRKINPNAKLNIKIIKKKKTKNKKWWFLWWVCKKVGILLINEFYGILLINEFIVPLILKII